MTTIKPAKKAAKKKGFEVSSDNCTLGARGEWVPSSKVRNPKSLLRSGHLIAKEK